MFGLDPTTTIALIIGLMSALTMVLLVAAFAGLGRMKAAYAHAIAGRYRFFSYGDATLLFPENAA